MQKLIKSALPMEQPAITVGLDLGDRFSQYCMLNRDGEVVETGRIQTTEVALRRHFEGEPTLRVALECGTHSAWISRLLEQFGHQVLVANHTQDPRHHRQRVQERPQRCREAGAVRRARSTSVVAHPSPQRRAATRS